MPFSSIKRNKGISDLCTVTIILRDVYMLLKE